MNTTKKKSYDKKSISKMLLSLNIIKNKKSIEKTPHYSKERTPQSMRNRTPQSIRNKRTQSIRDKRHRYMRDKIPSPTDPLTIISTYLPFGYETDKVKKLFNGFNNFNYTTDFANKIGKTSNNGFVYEITYIKDNYEGNALLKSSIEQDSDNLYYEYLVGKLFLNHQNKRFPCFTETYNCLLNTSDDTKRRMMYSRENMISMNEIKNNFEFLGDDTDKNVKSSCKNSANLAILLQYIKKPVVFNDFLQIGNNSIYYEPQMTQILYQIYGPLSILRNVYTHYDLHANNVLLYRLEPRTFIKMKYLYQNETVEFNTHFISKIIDYGRSYFRANSNDNSKEILKKICNERECETKNTKCGTDMGYAWMEIPKTEKEYKDSHYICSSFSNMSHDLKLITDLDNVKIKNGYLKKIIQDVHYETLYGTPARDESATGNSANVIYNVLDMANRLKHEMVKETFIHINQQMYLGLVCIGTITVDMHGNNDMDYVSAL